MSQNHSVAGMNIIISLGMSTTIILTWSQFLRRTQAGVRAYPGHRSNQGPSIGRTKASDIAACGAHRALLYLDTYFGMTDALNFL
jgi:hypothetical protein